MGIHGLSKLLGDHAARAVKESDIKAYEGETEKEKLKATKIGRGWLLLADYKLDLYLHIYNIMKKISLPCLVCIQLRRSPCSHSQPLSERS